MEPYFKEIYIMMLTAIRNICNPNSRRDEIDNRDKEKSFDCMSNEALTRRSPHPISPTPPGSPNANAFTNAPLNKEKNRIQTFKNWNVPFIDKKQLAQIGFYYIGPTDLVKCFFCGVEIGMWQPEDNPVDEHLKWSVNCSLLRGRETDNEPIDAEALKRVLPTVSFDTCGIRTSGSGSSYAESPASHPSELSIRTLSPQPGSSSFPESDMTPIVAPKHEHPEFQIESHRLLSFEDWPKTMKQKPKELAEAGFYYTGKGDRVACFSCGGGLKDWEEMDVPWEQHAMWYSKCEYLKLMKGQEFIDEILARKNTPPSSFTESSCSHQEPKSSDITPATLLSTNIAKDDEQKSVNDSKLCKICYECEYNTAFFPCGHIIACAKCASSVTKCPYCRQPFTRVMRVYFS
jgi:baculoviral IAP repeat-containing protein 7/8